MTTESDARSGGGGPTSASEGPLVIAHRGASRDHSENTCEAFAGAAELGATWVEFDVRRTSDDALVVHHDARLSDGRIIVDTKQADLPNSVPLLDEALAVCVKHRLAANVEIKSDRNDPDYDDRYVVAQLVAMRLASDSYFGIDGGSNRCLVSSFDSRCLAKVRDVEPSLRTAQLALGILDVERFISDVRGAGHCAVNPWYGFVNDSLMVLARAAGLEVYPWTVDDPAAISSLAEHGVDGIITNVPAVMVSVLKASRGS